MNSLTKPLFLLTLVMLTRLVSLATIAVLACLPSDGLTSGLCPLFQLTGIPCPFCGLTRSISSGLHGELGRSIAYHPLGIAVLVYLVAIAWSGKMMLKIGRLNINLTSNKVQLVTLGVFFVTWIVRLGLSGVENL